MGHSTSSGRNAQGGSEALRASFQQAGERRAANAERNRQAQELIREINENGHATYRGIDIDGQVYGEGTYSVSYAGDDILSDTIDGAMRTVDDLLEYERRNRR